MIALVSEDPETVAVLLAGAVASSTATLVFLKWLVDLDSRLVPPPAAERLPGPWVRQASAVSGHTARAAVPGVCEETAPLTTVQASRARHRRPGPSHEPRAGRTVQAGEVQ
ncbi:hypothetical protein AB0I84_06125 [Streptomyces spectabilis]|uniref:hypothetical protein n=1 Tax=Streptomyces spectabilis TaxID=68270 RepID=UPI0033C2CD41